MGGVCNTLKVMRNRSTCKILVSKSKGVMSHRRHKLSWDDDDTYNLSGNGFFVNISMTRRVSYNGEFLD
jgi:hypothetical protein